jgi:Mannosyltransferase (PIG-V)
MSLRVRSIVPVRSDERVDDRSAVRLYLTLACITTVAVAVGPWLVDHPNAPPRPRVVFDSVLGGWLRWDGWWYAHIAGQGYTYQPHRMSPVAFFPVYPLAARAVAAVVPGGVELALLLTTILCGAAVFVLFQRWCRRRMEPRAARASMCALALYPFAWFLYGAAYSDALYFALALGAFLLLEQHRPGAAGLVGAIATATRPTGITLIIGLVAVAAGDPKLRARAWMVLFSAAGLLAWMAWLAISFGNPLAFIETEGAPGWDQPPGWHTWLKLGLPDRLLRMPPPEAISIVLQIVVCVFFLAMIPVVVRRFGAGYGIYAAVAIVVPALSSGDFLGVGRYLLPVFPVFAAIGAAADATAHRAAVRMLAFGSAVLLLFGAALFSAGFLLS